MTTLAEMMQEAVTLDRLGKFAEAKAVCRRMVALKPDHPDILHLLGVVESHAGELRDAAAHISQALALKHDMPDAWINLAKVNSDLQDWTNAILALETALIYAPRRADVTAELGFCHDKLGRPGAAMACYERAISLDPNLVRSRTGLATILLRRDPAAAQKHLEAALKLSPTDPIALVNMAVLRDMQGRLNDILPLYDKAVAANPTHADSHNQRALTLLSQGKFEEGWTESVWRLRRPGIPTLFGRFPMPTWDGAALDGKTILVWTEQGPGDEILAGSMVPDLLERGARCIIACSTRLVPLFQRSFPSAQVLEWGQAARDAAQIKADVQASLSELGRWLRPSFESFPPARPYLRADEEKTRRLRKNYQGKQTDTPLVGISWSSANISASAEKSMSLAAWAPILRTKGVRWVSLQYGDCAAEVKKIGRELDIDIIHDPSVDPLRDMDTFAAQVAAMDHVISASNTTVHVAGGLGKPVWTLVPYGHGRIWYWFLDRSDSPWYPSMKLYRQKPGAGWNAVIATVAADLANARTS